MPRTPVYDQFIYSAKVAASGDTTIATCATGKRIIVTRVKLQNASGTKTNATLRDSKNNVVFFTGYLVSDGSLDSATFDDYPIRLPAGANIILNLDGAVSTVCEVYFYQE